MGSVSLEQGWPLWHCFTAVSKSHCAYPTQNGRCFGFSALFLGPPLLGVVFCSRRALASTERSHQQRITYQTSSFLRPLGDRWFNRTFSQPLRLSCRTLANFSVAISALLLLLLRRVFLLETWATNRLQKRQQQQQTQLFLSFFVPSVRFNSFVCLLLFSPFSFPVFPSLLARRFTFLLMRSRFSEAPSGAAISGVGNKCSIWWLQLGWYFCPQSTWVTFIRKDNHVLWDNLPQRLEVLPNTIYHGTWSQNTRMKETY